MRAIQHQLLRSAASSNSSGFKIAGEKIQNIENIFSSNGSNTWYGHYGSRIVFDKEGYLYLSVGEGGSTSYGGPATGNNNAQGPEVKLGENTQTQG